MSSIDRSKERVIAQGRIWELLALPQPDGRTFELARRAPGVRVIIADKDAKKLLLTKEFRGEVSGFDLRLPGGKVFDTLKEYEAFLSSGKDIIVPASTKAIAESAEEAGIEVDNVKLIRVSKLGATIEWDLFVFEATGWNQRESGQSLEAGEEGTEVTWISFAEAKTKILDGHLQEERVALILLQWLASQ
jgi:8-oxo-dGTP pyrophosphatase MutT (NUDIX family)